MIAPVRFLAFGGIVGPSAFVTAWTIASFATTGYSPIDMTISELAAVDAPTRVAMTVGFIVFGLGLVAFGLALREALAGEAWIAAVVTGAATIGVAATPLGGWSGDAAHAALAGIGYAALVALPLLAAAPLAHGGRQTWARVSVLTAAISVAFLTASSLGPAHGLSQRIGLTVCDLWIVVIASAVVADMGLVTNRERT